MFSFFGASSAQIRRYVSVIFYYVTVQYYQSNINHQIKSNHIIRYLHFFFATVAKKDKKQHNDRLKNILLLQLYI